MASNRSGQNQFQSDGLIHNPNCSLPCPMPDVVRLIGGKWKLIILQILIFSGMKRFGELKSSIDGITQTMLTSQLRALEKDGLVHRKVYPEVPPRVEYSATPLAMDLQHVFFAMQDWWKRHLNGCTPEQ